MKTFAFQIKFPSANVKFPIDNLMEEFKPEVTEKRELISSYIKNHSTFQNFRTIPIVTQLAEPQIFQWSTLVQVEGFRLRPQWKN